MDLLSRTYTCALGIKVLKSYDKIILLYSELAEQAKKLGLPEGKIRIIPNGIDVKKIFDTQKRFDAESIRKKFGITEDEKVILYVGRLVKMKRVEIIITVIKKLLERNLKVKGLIVGDGPQRTELEKMARPINHHIKFTGYLSEERFECYHIADLFILPSISEGLPTVLLEGALFGLPIIATNTHGVPDVVIHGKTGFLASRWNYYDQYTEYAERLLRDQSLAREIGENARKYVAGNFSWNKVVMKYEKVYEETAK
jgi:glycosyltransferase involved in cell wall biosynthesis